MQCPFSRVQSKITIKNAKEVNKKINQYYLIGKEIIKARDSGKDILKSIEKIINWSEFVTSVNETEKLIQPLDYSYLGFIKNKYYPLRKYTPTFLNILKFKSYKENDSIIDAINILIDLNNSKKRKIDFNVPIDLIPDNYKKYLYKEDGTVDRYYYEIAVLDEIRKRVRSGDLSIEGSNQYNDFETYLIPKDKWNHLKKENNIKINSEFKEYISVRQIDYTYTK